MLNLKPPPEPEWKEWAPGFSMLMRPGESAMLLAGRKAAGVAAREGAGDADVEFAFGVGCVLWAALEWKGVGGPDGQPAPLDPVNVETMLRQNFDVFDRIDREFVTPVLETEAEKNASSPSPNGSSTGATPIVSPAPAAARNAPSSSTAPGPSKAKKSGAS